MTIGELRAYLQEHDDDVEVRLATQPRWAFEYSLRDLVTDDEIRLQADYDKAVDEGREDEWEGTLGESRVVYLLEGSQLGYMPGGSTAWSVER